MLLRKLLSFILLSSFWVFSSCAPEETIEAKLSKKWSFQSITDSRGNKVKKATASDSLSILKTGKKFSYFIKEEGIEASGTWTVSGKTLTFIYEPKPSRQLIDSTVYSVEEIPQLLFYKEGKEVTRIKETSGINVERQKREYEIVKYSNTELVLIENGITYSFSYTQQIVPTGMSFNSIWRGLLGIIVLTALLFVLSSHKRAVPWKLVFSGILFQLLFAIGILKIPFIQKIFESISYFFVIVLDFTREGSRFVFGNLLNADSFGFIFAFQILPTILFFSALTSLFFYLGILQKIVYALAWLMGKTMKISGAENLSAAANIFLGQTEAPLMIKHYLPNMTRSELLCVMVGGMATTAGGVLAAYVGFLGGDDPVQQLFFAKHLLASSVMSAPATIVAAKILLPQTERIEERLELSKEKLGNNMLEAIANGTTDGLKLAVNVAAMLIVFIALIAMVNYVISDMIGVWTGLNTKIAVMTGGQYKGLTLQFILGYIGAPLCWLIGVSKADMLLVGQLLGEKTILNEFVAYGSLGSMKLMQMFSEQKSIIMATYILSGFANFSSIGIQLGGIGALAPNKRTVLAELGIKALIGGTIASLYTATIVGMLL